MTKKTVTEEQNGLDVEKLKQTCDVLCKKPDLGKSLFRVKNQWVSGGHNKVTIKDYYTAGQEQKTREQPFHLQADEPPALLGSDQGANPVEYLLSALSSCMTTSIIYHAAARGIAIDQLSSSFEGDLDLRGFLGLDPNVPKGYSKIRALFHVKTNASKEEIAKLYTFSPVYDMVSRSVPIEVSIEIL